MIPDVASTIVEIIKELWPTIGCTTASLSTIVEIIKELWPEEQKATDTAYLR